MSGLSVPPLVEISPLQVCEAMGAMALSPVYLEFGSDLLGLHAAYWLASAGRSLGLLLDAHRSSDELLDAMEEVARSYARPFARGVWRARLSTTGGLSLAARADSDRPGVLLALGDTDPTSMARVRQALRARAMIFRADAVRDGDALEALARDHGLALHALRLPAVVAPSSTRRAGVPGAPVPLAQDRRAARERGVVTVDQALLALASLVGRVASEEGGAPTVVTHALEAAHRARAATIEALLPVDGPGEDGPPRWTPEVVQPLVALAPGGAAVTTGIFDDDLEVTMALAAQARGSVFAYRCVVADDGALLAVYDTDPGVVDRPTVVACNAFGMPAELLEPLARSLHARFRVVTWQSRGVPVVCQAKPEDLTMERQVRDLEAVLSHTHARRPVLLGWCLGAQVALEAAARAGSAISALVLLNGVFTYDEAPQTDWQKNLLGTASYVLSAPANAAKMCAFVYGTPKARPSGAPNVYAAATRRGDAVLGRMTSQPFRNPESLRRYATFVAHATGRAACVDRDRLPPRTLFVAGREDQVVTPQSIALASRRVPRARLVELPDGDHYGHYYEPERYARLIEEVVADETLQSTI